VDTTRRKLETNTKARTDKQHSDSLVRPVLHQSSNIFNADIVAVSTWLGGVSPRKWLDNSTHSKRSGPKNTPFQYLVRTTSTFSMLRLSSTRHIWTEARVSPSSSPPGAQVVNTRSEVPSIDRVNNTLTYMDLISNPASPSVHTRMGGPCNLRNTPQSVQYLLHCHLNLF